VRLTGEMVEQPFFAALISPSRQIGVIGDLPEQLPKHFDSFEKL
jgi:hypothetical protein